ncbi:MAG: N-acetyltransferase [Burkholderiaceae bacterium]|nr:N-acetyltransferase [Burkholderiaceae bacterium]
MSTAPSAFPPIVHNVAESRFEVRIDGWLCRCDYRHADDVMQLVHTEVAPAIEGRGIAARLVKAAVDHARANGLKVQPRCSYVRVYFQRHPEERDLLVSA